MNYQNAETNATKECLSIKSQRQPTLNNSKIFNGGDTINMKVEKNENNYIVPRINGADKLYTLSRSYQDNGDITNMKHRLEDTDIANRINKDLLNPFREILIHNH